ncbi:MAG: hypothetical protein H0W96_13710 [Solirubrobacterales bacterium]|nr:hypothetical protein [Solirubrobacterales bacterium]
MAIALAALSWHAFEAPLNRLKRRFPYQRASEQPSAASLRAPVAQQSSP